MLGEEVWLVGERRSTGEQKYYVSNLPADTTIKMLAATIKARWVCQQAHQQLKEELGLDHFEGRSWTGLHRHALMTMIAYAFLQSRRLKAAEGEKKSRGAATEHAGNQRSSTSAHGPLRLADVKLAAENALNGNDRRYDARAMPEVVFTDPQAARAGLSKAEACAQGLAALSLEKDIARLSCCAG